MSASSPRLFTLPFGLAVAFAGGIAVSLAVPLSPSSFVLLGAGGVAALWRLRRSRADGFRRVLAVSACGALVVAAAGAATAARAHRAYADAPLLRLVAGQPADPARVTRVRGWVISEPVHRLDRLRFSFQVEQVEAPEGWRPCRGRVRISVRSPSPGFDPSYGSRWEMPLRLRPGRSFRNPGAFDYRLSLEAEGIHLLGSLKSSLLARPLSGGAGSAPLVGIHRLRARWIDRLECSFQGPQGEEARRFLAAILLGEREGGDGRTDTLFRRTGVYHILSISGMHFALLLAFLRALGRRLPWRRWTEPALLAGVGGAYVLLSGGEDPILRCALAAALQEAGARAERKVSGWDAQSLSALLLMAITPMHLFTPAFQLSFLATWGILALGDLRWPLVPRIPWVVQSLKASFGAWMASTPLMACWFLQASPVALLLNLLAAPFLTISMVLGGLLLIHPSAALAQVMEVLLDWFARLCALALQVPGACLRVPSPSFPLAASLAALVLARLHCRADAREARALSLAVLAALVLLVMPPDPWLPPDRLSVLVLDVGQGDAILIGVPGPKWILVDAGGFASSDFDVGERVVFPALMARGVRRLEAAILTHAHQDHGGGLPAILEDLPPREIWLGGAPPEAGLVREIVARARRQGIPILHPSEGMMRCFAGACLEVLHPPAASLKRDRIVANDDSLVLRLAFGRSAALLTGDVEAEGEARIVPLLRSRPVQLLKVAHHGSASSTSSAFLEAAAPAIAAISVGAANPWGHPATQVIDRLEKRRIEVYRTDLDGAIEWESEGWSWRRRAVAGPP